MHIQLSIDKLLRNQNNLIACKTIRILYEHAQKQCSRIIHCKMNSNYTYNFEF